MTEIKSSELKDHLKKLCRELVKVDPSKKDICDDYLKLVNSPDTTTEYITADIKVFGEKYLDQLIECKIGTSMVLQWNPSDISPDNPALPIGEIYNRALEIKTKKETELKSLPQQAAAEAHELNWANAILLHLCRAVNEVIPGKLDERLTKIKQDLKIIPKEKAAVPNVGMLTDLTTIVSGAMGHPTVKQMMSELDADARNIKGPEDAIKLLSKVMTNQNFMNAIGGIVEKKGK